MNVNDPFLSRAYTSIQTWSDGRDTFEQSRATKALLAALLSRAPSLRDEMLQLCGNWLNAKLNDRTCVFSEAECRSIERAFKILGVDIEALKHAPACTEPKGTAPITPAKKAFTPSGPVTKPIPDDVMTHILRILNHSEAGLAARRYLRDSIPSGHAIRLGNFMEGKPDGLVAAGTVYGLLKTTTTEFTPGKLRLLLDFFGSTPEACLARLWRAGIDVEDPVEAASA